MIINKFGGEIMGKPELVKLALKQVKSQYQKGQKPVVVVSALQGVTDELELVLERLYQKRKANGIVKLFVKDISEKHEDWINDCIDEEENIRKIINDQIEQLAQDLTVVARFGELAEVSDRVLSYGEKLSSALFTELLKQNNILAKRYTGEELGIVTDEIFGDANVDYDKSERNIHSKIKNSRKVVPVITGFVGRTIKNQTTTLGRGGSDTTACVVGAALKASKVILWKNVPGVLTADPRVVPKAKTVKSLNYEQAEESGKVIHDKSMQYIRREGIVVEVAFIRNYRQKTVITKKGSSQKGVKIISSKDHLRLMIVIGDKIKRYGALAEIATIITKHKINMALIRNTRDSLYIILEQNGHDVTDCEEEIRALGYEIRMQDVSMVTVIGSLPWHVVEKFNHWLHLTYPEAVLGAFPYRDCVRLEAAVAPGQVRRLVKKFHEKFIK